MRPIRLSYADWGRAEHRAARRAWLGGSRRTAPADLAERLRQRLTAAGGIHVVNAARSGLTLALSACRRLRGGSVDVVVPAYVCPAVPDAVLASGARPAPVAVGPDLNLDPDAVERRLARGGVLAVVAAHMYAAPARIDRIERLCRDAGVFLIDDAAQVLGIDVDGRPLGSFGDVGLLSFAQSKTIVTGVGGSGGALSIRDDALAAALEPELRDLRPAPGVRRRLLRFYRDYLAEARTRTAVYYLKRLGLGPRPMPPYPIAGIAAVEAEIALAQLDSLDARLAQRREQVARLAAALTAIDGIRLPQVEAGYLARFMIELPAGVGRAAVRERLAAADIQTRGGYDVACLRPYPAAEDVDLTLADRLLELPVPPAEDAAARDRIAAALVRACAVPTSSAG